MVTLTFPDRKTEKRALTFLLARFSGRVQRTGEHLVPESALEALADQNIPFTVKGNTTYEQQAAAVRGSVPPPVREKEGQDRAGYERYPESGADPEIWESAAAWPDE